ncbi:AMP-binding protein [Desarmillaria tabescens]|uniref:AMP-binding protein n=1 Tax=Armillaria tabescens TaxID=1929756 RepID=A0AA39N8V2_ARMTA|nr:AMP-binding protein [Desarmillaria tabescens]KAK0461162.1 AMP-binding protein [Desarmillaria tabescens]
MESPNIFTAGLRFLHHILLAALGRYFLVATQPVRSTKDLKQEVSEKISDSLISDHCFGPRVDARFNCVHHVFESTALSNSDQVAVVDHLGNSMSYSQLDHLSLRLASYLTSRGVRPGSFVGLVVQRSIPQVVAILGVLRAGAAYIPLDGDIIRDDTLQGIMADAGPSYVLVSKGCISRADLLSHPYGCLEDVLDSMKDSDTDFIQDQSKGSDTAYIIFTSGTTGKPKGVMVSHSNVVNLLSNAPRNLHIEPGVKVAQLLNIGFDMCAWEILGCLMNGGTLYLRGPRRADWIKVLKTVDVVVATPTILLPHDPKDFPNVRVVATAGEPCPQSLADKWASQATFYNSCGPTEITIVNTMHKHVPNTPLSIGRLTANNTVYILDEYLQSVPFGTPGVMWAGGKGVSKGYLGLDDLTAKRFLPDPYLNDGSLSSRMYNTGDIGKWREDGSLDHLGRADDQVKIKGFRVELDGVSAAMQSCPGVTGACALLVEDELVGFYTPSELAMDGVRDAVTRILPWYSVPTKFISIPSLPLTKSGKTDKGELRSIAIQQIFG